MNDTDRKAEDLINNRFAKAIRIAVSHTLKAVEKERDNHLRDELNQEARVLVLRYAGIMDGWGFGRLARFATQTDNDEAQIQLLVINQLKIDLAQILERSRTESESSFHIIEKFGLEPVDYAQEDRIIEQVDRREEVNTIRLLYPTLARNVIDGMTQAEIAEENGTSERWIRYKIASEKKAFLTGVIRHKGLVITGDESIDELVEAYEFLTASRPSERLRSNNPVRNGHRPIRGQAWNREWCKDCREECNAMGETKPEMCRCCFNTYGESKTSKRGKRQESNESVEAALQLINNNERS